MRSFLGLTFNNIHFRLLHGNYNYVRLNVTQQLKTLCQCEVGQLNKSLPEDCKIDPYISLPTSTVNYHKHVLLISPKHDAWESDWTSKVELSSKFPYSSLLILKQELAKNKNNQGILINTICLSKFSNIRNSIDYTKLHFLVIPDFRIYTVEEKELKDFAFFLGKVSGSHSRPRRLAFHDFEKGANNIGNLDVAESTDSISNGSLSVFSEQKFTKDLILVCGHRNRDARCGLLAPHLVANLSAQKFATETDIVISSHVGGHKFAGNIIWYRNLGVSRNGKNNVDGLWFAKILPSLVPTLVSSINNGEIIQDLFRGGISN